MGPRRPRPPRPLTCLARQAAQHEGSRCRKPEASLNNQPQRDLVMTRQKREPEPVHGTAGGGSGRNKREGHGHAHQKRSTTHHRPRRPWPPNLCEFSHHHAHFDHWAWHPAARRHSDIGSGEGLCSAAPRGLAGPARSRPGMTWNHEGRATFRGFGGKMVQHRHSQAMATHLGAAQHALLLVVTLPSDRGQHSRTSSDSPAGRSTTLAV